MCVGFFVGCVGWGGGKFVGGFGFGGLIILNMGLLKGGVWFVGVVCFGGVFVVVVCL
jgi:hypothetical protein